jgi:hypothetical protein
MMEDSYKSNKKVLKLPPLVDVNDAIWHQETEKETDRRENLQYYTGKKEKTETVRFRFFEKTFE